MGALTKSDLKVHLVWIPKYRKAVLTGEVALRVRDLLRQIAAEHELEIVSGKVARDHVHLLLSYRTNQGVSQIVQWLKGMDLPPNLRQTVKTQNSSNGELSQWDCLAGSLRKSSS
jgi:putative transposase